MKKYPFCLCIVFLLLITLSCKKEKDILAPEINITYPIENNLFHVYDTISIKADVKDQSALSFVKFDIVDENLIPVTSPIIVNPYSTYYTVNINYPIENTTLQTAVYYVHIAASDGNNVKNSYRKIYIYGTARKLKYMAAITKTNYNTLQVTKIDSLFNATSMFSVSSDFAASDINCTNQLLYISGNYFGNLNAYNLYDNTLAWSIPALINPPFPCFINCFYNGTYLLSSNYDGMIKGYYQYGTQNYSVTASSGMYPGITRQCGEYLVTELTNKLGSSKFLTLYYYSSAAFMQQLPINYSMVDLFSKDNQNIVLFANEAGQGKIKNYVINDNNTWDPITLPGGNIYAAAQVDANHYLITHDNGIYLYEYNTSSVVLFASFLNARKIKFDPLSNQLFACNAKSIKCYNYPSGTLVNTVTLSDTIRDFHLVYNK